MNVLDIILYMSITIELIEYKYNQLYIHIFQISFVARDEIRIRLKNHV